MLGMLSWLISGMTTLGIPGWAHKRCPLGGVVDVSLFVGGGIILLAENPDAHHAVKYLL